MLIHAACDLASSSHEFVLQRLRGSTPSTLPACPSRRRFLQRSTCSRRTRRGRWSSPSPTTTPSWRAWSGEWAWWRWEWLFLASWLVKEIKVTKKLESMFTKDVITCSDIISDNNINSMTAIDMITSILIMRVNEVRFQFEHMMILPIKETKL